MLNKKIFIITAALLVLIAAGAVVSYSGYEKPDNLNECCKESSYINTSNECCIKNENNLEMNQGNFSSETNQKSSVSPDSSPASCCK
ncbi:MAG: hypothetical protein KKF16_06305 [Euryarchaeota archaeon]|nr:hypothetical protein [Euryarchaeota archaeon]MBU4548179.1 hypothetical protein [Euryarchaeota archaeon]MBU4608154.1 hypothetical protein [Euryarchaeota archaeon]MBV1728672.1 hypothetical protein [Methanobacterium sp.]MBV1755965.1 hypothetical protein [Methanobacterium sp.]